MRDKRKAYIALIMSLWLKKRRKRRMWVKDWIGKRNIFTHVNLLNEIKKTDVDDFQRYFRMDEKAYYKLLEMVRPYITKQDTIMRESISANERLSITLRYLATGESFSRLCYSGIMGKSTISGIVQETCEAIITALKDYIKVTITYTRGI